jgi:hypothetical protein
MPISATPYREPRFATVKEDALLISMKELVTRSSSSMGIPPHPTFGVTSCLIAKGSDA